jgi:hypothetical protein
MAPAAIGPLHKLSSFVLKLMVNVFRYRTVIKSRVGKQSHSIRCVRKSGQRQLRLGLKTESKLHKKCLVSQVHILLFI